MILDKMMSSEKRINFVCYTVMILIFIAGFFYIKEIISYNEEITREKIEYLKKIENYYPMEKNQNKELILEELQKRDLKFLKNYYFKILNEK